MITSLNKLPSSFLRQVPIAGAFNRTCGRLPSAAPRAFAFYSEREHRLNAKLDFEITRAGNDIDGLRRVALPDFPSYKDIESTVDESRSLQIESRCSIDRAQTHLDVYCKYLSQEDREKYLTKIEQLENTFEQNAYPLNEALARAELKEEALLAVNNVMLNRDAPAKDVESAINDLGHCIRKGYLHEQAIAVAASFFIKIMQGSDEELSDLASRELFYCLNHESDEVFEVCLLS